tara:strand:- start:115628 stop:116110 length:483 start_codon:yes stop_codon:yes gene_type:complete
MKTERLTVFIETQNRMGILSKILNIFLEEQVILSEVYTSELPFDTGKLITVEVLVNKINAEKILKYIKDIEGVINVNMTHENEIIYRRIILFQFITDAYLEQSALQQIIEENNVQIIDINKEFIIMSKSGSEIEIDKFIKELQPYNFNQFVMSGKASIRN